jgi:hypothetical protein
MSMLRVICNKNFFERSFLMSANQKRDLSREELQELVTDVAEAMLDFPAWKQKWLPVWDACLKMNATKEEAIAGFKYCLIIDKQMQEEELEEKKSLEKFVTHALKKGDAA